MIPINEAQEHSQDSIDSNAADDMRWDEAFSRSPDALAKLGAIAMTEYHAGNTQELDPETLYLLSQPGMRESIREGMATPIEDCARELEW